MSHYPQVCGQFSPVVNLKLVLLSGHAFEWPDLKIKSATAELEEDSATQEDVEEAKATFAKQVKADTTKYRPGVPTFFGL